MQPIESSSTPPSPETPKAAAAESVESAPADGHAHTPVRAAPGTGKWITAMAILIAAGLGVTFYVVSHRRDAEDQALRSQAAAVSEAPLPVDVVRVQYGNPSHSFALPGEARAWYETTIYARVNGYLSKWCVDIGDHVHEGQALATIDTPELDQQFAAAKAKVDASAAQVKLAEANVHFSEVTGARFKDAPKGVVSDLERDEKEADYQVSQAKLTTARSELSSAQAEVDRLRAMIAFQKVTAPFDGVITDRNVDLGDLVTAGSTSNTTALYKIAQSDKMRIFVDVPQSTIADIHDGSKAIVVPHEYSGVSLEGQVARTSRAISSAAKTLRVEVDVPNSNAVLLPGMYVEVNFVTPEEKPHLQIPASALNFRSGGPQVAVIGEDNAVKFKSVTILRDLGNFVEIADGLALNDRVALNISNQITDGDRVTVNHEQGQPGDKSSPHALISSVSTSPETKLYHP